LTLTLRLHLLQWFIATKFEDCLVLTSYGAFRAQAL